MTEQLEFRTKTTRPKRSEGDALRLQTYLSLRDGWQTGISIRISLGWDERRLRDAAEASDLVLSAPGCSLGYRLATGCPVAEFEREIYSRYHHQIERMQARLVKMTRAVHGNS